uniref:Oxysterol-binding protein-related protein 3 n=1 Tax=Pseudonaja textilis TaxID=8673 RepID=A0A670ZI63_PSETE
DYTYAMVATSTLSMPGSSHLSAHQSACELWEIIEGLRGVMNCTQEPQKQEGFLLKKRKWPLKGWHKRWFFLDKGILKYAKNPADIEKGKLHGCIDVGLSVMSVKKSTKCIDLDTEEHIYHLKVILPLFLFQTDLSHCHNYLLEMSQLLQSMEVLHRTYSAPAINIQQGLLFESPKKEKRTHRRWRSRALGKDAKGMFSEHQNRSLVHQISNESRLSITDSLTEFFDAQEVLLSASSSENEVSDDDSYASDISDNISEDNLSNDIENERQTLDCVPDGIMECHSRRRTRLPAPCPNTSNISLWNILRNNIGKDLSKVSMPVGLNEPLNTLQKLCEELEYSELLDKAAFTPNPFERMVYVAAFAVSAYASSYYRAGSKPFNPVLGETYECICEDKGFQFFSEQVSHHPAISACHAESDNFIFWQDIRWKNKFWGKSIEIVPIGTTHVILPGFKDHYEWNKVTSCIHNILNGQRWIEHYGEIIIKNLNDDSCHCKLTFVKTKYWNRSVHDIEGNVLDKNGKVVHRLFGKWHENIYCGTPSSPNCIWRANPMPKDYEQWYGFTQFALELNEFEPTSRSLLPPTDTRFRPDQRFLEEGNIEGAEIQKQRIEELQRARRKVLEESNIEHHPRFFRKSADDSWVSNGTYLELRKNPGFSMLDNPVLW